MRSKIVSSNYDLVNANGIKVDKSFILFANQSKREIDRMEHCITLSPDVDQHQKPARTIQNPHEPVANPLLLLGT